MKLHQLLDNSSETPAVLCGSGISLASGLPTAAGLYDLFGNYVADEFAKTLFARHKPSSEQDLAEPPYTPIRFEGILDVLQRLLIDPNLTVLEPYRNGEPGPSHMALATLAIRSPVVTVNFDGLIERCMTSQGRGKRVFFTEAHFSSGVPAAGLWKIHGTVVDPSGRPIDADMDGGPVGTLRVISRVRESKSRQAFLSALLKQYAVIIVGYSGSDDFDITRWLRDAENPRQLIWIQYTKMLGHEIVLEADLLPSSKGYSSCDFDSGLRRLARAWQHKGQLAKLTVLRSGNPESLLCDLVGNCFTPNKLPGRAPLPLTAGPISEWQKLVVTGAMLADLSYYQTAIGYLRRAAEEAPDEQRCATSLIELSRALLRLGGSNASFDEASEAAQRASTVAARTDDQDLINRAANYANLMRLHACHLGKAGQMSEAELDVLESNLEQFINKCTVDAYIEAHGSIGFEALAVLQRVRRFRGKPPGQVILDGIEKFEKFGLLDAKATMGHDRALNYWKLGISREDLDAAVKALHEAAELREDLGDVSGASASWNVLGFMYQRLAWLFPLERDAMFARAEYASKMALVLAQRNAIPFAESQAMIGKIVLHLRRWEPSEASDNLAIIAVRSFQLDARTKLEARFCVIFHDATKPVEERKRHEQLGIAAEAFDRLSSDIRDSTDDRLSRIRVCARVNAVLCKAWANDSAAGFVKLGSLYPLTPTLIIDKLRALAEAAPPKTLHERAAMLLDPLGP
ncbi:MAG TPA: hypothetical protein DEO56_11420 [Nitrosomonas nitrosa]|nr:hypothetical protein [Nitrosomonas nitrosa]HNP52674.1 SIR2 family protein [Nitrosomonas nitrosa]